MHSKPFRIPDDIPPSLCTLIELFCSDALRVRCVAEETVNAEILYLIRFFRHFGLPDSPEGLVCAVSPSAPPVRTARLVGPFHRAEHGADSPAVYPYR